MAAAVSGLESRHFQTGRDILIFAQGGRRQMPGAFHRQCGGVHRRGQRPVHCAPGGWRRAVVGRRSHQRVAEPDANAVAYKQPDCFGMLQVGKPGVQLGTGATHLGDRTGLRRGKRQQSELILSRQARDPLLEGSLNGWARGQRIRQRFLS